MDKAEAGPILAARLELFRAKSYTELAGLIGDVQVFEETGPSGTLYILEVDVLWDHRPNGNLRVFGSIDDGGLWSAFSPLSDDFVLTPDGGSLGE